MSSGDSVFLYLLIGGNLVVYILLTAGVIRARSGRLPKNPTVEEAFKILENSIYHAFPDLPPGFTWNEIINRIKSLNLELDWFEIESTFKKYEDFRYGGIQYRNANVDVIMQFAANLPRGEKSASIAQIERS